MPQSLSFSSEQHAPDWIDNWDFNDCKPGDWLKVPKNNKRVRKIWGHDKMPWIMYPDAPELFTYLPNHALLQVTGPNKRIRSISWVPVSYNNQQGWLRKEHAKVCLWRPTLRPADLAKKQSEQDQDVDDNPFSYPLTLENARIDKLVRVKNSYGVIKDIQTDRLPDPTYQARIQLEDQDGRQTYAWLQQCYTDEPLQSKAKPESESGL